MRFPPGLEGKYPFVQAHAPAPQGVFDALGRTSDIAVEGQGNPEAQSGHELPRESGSHAYSRPRQGQIDIPDPGERISILVLDARPGHQRAYPRQLRLAEGRELL